ncbi:hypothetical protein CORT_0D02660 [Candida orthopsilosis Co 90-125]|uniref:Sodium/calcium exchanger membrane region domain-containing protein n=1 Tax=Candida orthopsilosis (strain 90-125) TaxID=1136231 RepID=H8X518_CANO9|nr:hypothetical protein CORT_0D02660 [Candida orthopsilosis Co 90-125]CCG23111.1 hypothetical protein CORT_0D02660 [Candida orthopsilosis Co 90-125]
MKLLYRLFQQQQPKAIQLLLVTACLIGPTTAFDIFTTRSPNPDDDSNQCSFPQKAHLNHCSYIEQNCDSTYFKLAQLYYCQFHNVASLIFISSTILFTLCLILLSLSILVSNYLFRNLNELTMRLGLNNQILSFILIPLTNSIADLINYHIALEQGSSNLVIGQLMGSILIMFTIIIGSIAILTKGFKVEHPKILIIDLGWILAVLVLFAYVLSDGKINQLECIIMCLVYVVYVVFLGIFDKEKLRDYDEELLIEHYDGDDEEGCQHILEQPYNVEDALDIISNDEHSYGSFKSISRSASPRNSPKGSQCSSPLGSRVASPLPISPLTSPTPMSPIAPNQSLPNIDIVDEGEVDGGIVSEAVDYLSVHYIPKDHNSPSPYPSRPRSRPCSRQSSYHSHLQLPHSHSHTPVSLHKRIMTITFQHICNFIDFIFIFLIPFHRCIELEDSEWKAQLRQHKYLPVWYLFVTPLLFNYQFTQFNLQFLIPIVTLSIPVILYLKRFININTKIILISIVGTLNSLIIISNISIYILQMLKNLGLIWNISDYILGLLVFSISNSINDVITNITLATKINPILGINSCLGTPLLIILLGVGFNGLLVIQNQGGKAIKFDLKSSVILSTTALIITVTFILIYLPAKKWKFDRALGIVLVSWYLLIASVNLYLE